MKLKIKITRGLLLLRQELLPFMKGICLYLIYTVFGLHKFDDESFVNRLSRMLGASEMTPAQKTFFIGILKKKQFSQFELLSSFFRMPAHVFPFLKQIPINHAHHAARLIMTQKYLPKASRILDLGGASDHAAEGALLSMGYPYKPEHVCIVDQPHELREHYDVKIEPPQEALYQGTKVTYFYTLMSDLKAIPSTSFDMIWCGQSIEHITPQEADKLFVEAKRILTPGGYLCMDTPNSLLARLLTPYAFLHPEHKIEYRPGELVDALKRSEFKINKVCAISPMPISAQLKRFCRLELLENVKLSEDYDTGYSFYIEAQVS